MKVTVAISLVILMIGLLSFFWGWNCIKDFRMQAEARDVARLIAQHDGDVSVALELHGLIDEKHGEWQVCDSQYVIDGYYLVALSQYPSWQGFDKRYIAILSDGSIRRVLPEVAKQARADYENRK